MSEHIAIPTEKSGATAKQPFLVEPKLAETSHVPLLIFFVLWAFQISFHSYNILFEFVAT